MPDDWNAIELLLLGWAIVAFMMAVLWWFQRVHKDAGIVDVGWAAGLGLLAVLYAALSPGNPARRMLLVIIAVSWSFRLAGYLLFNRVIGKAEDGRYQSLRAHWGSNAQPYFFMFFQVQALLDVILSLSFVVPAFSTASLTWWDAAAIATWLIAVGGESTADAQLAKFRADSNNKGRTCRSGLWRYSRHPNYFFEWLHWFAYPLLAVGSTYWYATLLAPALMLFFILKVTGIPPTEAHALRSRGDDYREYQRTTSSFFPWFPRSISQ